MALNVGPTYARAKELRVQVENLRALKKRLNSYKSLLEINWQGTEVVYYIKAIDKTMEKITDTANALDSLAYSLESTARQIRSEELAEEERQRQAFLAEQARIEEEKAKAAVAAAKIAAITT